MKTNTFSDSELLAKTQIAAKNEKSATLELLRYLVQVDERRAYATLACSSLFDYVVRILGYSEMQTSERVNSVRLMRAIPTVEKEIESGNLSMSTASQVQRFLRQEKKVGNSISEEKTIEIIQTCAQQSKRTVEKTLFSLASEEAKVSAERISVAGAELTELRFLVSDSTFKKLNEVKNLIGNESLKDIFDRALDSLLIEVKKQKGIVTPKNKIEPVTKNGETLEQPKNIKSTEKDKLIAQPTFPGKLNPLPTRSRFISINLKRLIIARSQYQCEFVDRRTNTRCQSRQQLQFDHYPTPFAMGGRNEIDNLRHVCFQHNQKAAVNAGLSKITNSRPNKTHRSCKH